MSFSASTSAVKGTAQRSAPAASRSTESNPNIYKIEQLLQTLRINSTAKNYPQKSLNRDQQDLESMIKQLPKSVKRTKLESDLSKISKQILEQQKRPRSFAEENVPNVLSFSENEPLLVTVFGRNSKENAVNLKGIEEGFDIQDESKDTRKLILIDQSIEYNERLIASRGKIICF